MTEILFILFVLFVAYRWYQSTQDKKEAQVSPGQVGLKQSAAPVAAQTTPEKSTVVASDKKPQNVPTINPKPKLNPKQPVPPVAEKATEQKVVVVKSPAPRSPRKVVQVVTPKPVVRESKISEPELVGQTAGNIWNYLNINGATTVAKLVKALPDDEKMVQRSIGWLAQEGKITLEVIDRAETIALKK